MKRREVLGLCGTAAAALAGCLGRGRPPGEDSSRSGGTPTETTADGDPGTPPSATRTRTATETTTATPDRGRRASMGETITAGGTRITVESPRVRSLVVRNGVHRFLESHAGQYVVVDVTVDGPVGDAVGLQPSVEAKPLPSGPIRLRGPDGATPQSPAEWDADRVAFPFPARRHDAAGIRWWDPDPPVTWTLPGEPRATLALEPEFRLADVGVRRRNGELVLGMTVRNAGDRDGRFMAQVSMESFSGRRIVRLDVPAGDSRDYEGRANGMLTMLENNGGGTLTVRAPDDGDLTTRKLGVSTSETTGSGG